MKIDNKLSFGKRLLALLFAGCVIAMMSACKKESTNEVHAEPSSWLASIPNDTPVCSLSIPGAHDAATASMDQLVISLFAKTQTMSIADLFFSGVRAFDLRPALSNDQLEIFHGFFDTGTSFPDAIETLLDCIDKHPSEFAIVIIRHEEEGDGNDADWGRKMYEYLSSLPDDRVMREFDAHVTVAQLRGRILFLSRNEYPNGPIGAYIKGWYSGTELEKQKSATVGDGELWVQDVYDPSSKEEKLKAIEDMLHDFSSIAGPGVWCINHTSGYMPSIYNAPDYGENAQNVNGRTSEWLESAPGKAGIVMMDFAGEANYESYSVGGDRLLKAVLNNNPLTATIR